MKVTNTREIGSKSIKILVMGESGTGKTTLAKTIGEPTIILSAESGLLSLAGSDIDVIDLTRDDNGKLLPKDKRVDRVNEAYKYLLTDEAKLKYKWVFIDSLTEIQQFMFDSLKQLYPDRSQGLVLYGELAEKTRKVVESFRDLPGYNVVFTSLSCVEKDENNKRFISVDMIGKISQHVNQWLDEIFYMFVDPEQENKRFFITGNTEKVRCKDRSGKLLLKEPANIAQVITKIRAVPPQPKIEPTVEKNEIKETKK